MQVQVVDEQHIRLAVDGNDDGLEVVGAAFGPVQMLATSLALCTAAVMRDYATTAQFGLHRWVIDVQWAYAERPRRLHDIRMLLEVGPEVPPSRQSALLRAAETQCTVHNTLTHTTHIRTKLEVPGVEQA